MPKHAIISTINETINNTCSDAWRKFNNCSLEWAEPSPSIQDFWHNLMTGMPPALILIGGLSVITLFFVVIVLWLLERIKKKYSLQNENISESKQP